MTTVEHAARTAAIRRFRSEQAGLEPQHLIITLLGDYWYGRREMLPSAALVELLAEFGVQEPSARQAMRRLTQRDLLAREKIGRVTYYGTPARILDTQAARLRRAMSFGVDFVDWDGQWTVVTYSVSEHERDVRRVLRTRLRTLKFGLLSDAVWVSPHDQSELVTQLLDELAVASAVVMRSRIIPRADGVATLARVFPVDELRDAYDDFVRRHEPEVDATLGGRVSPATALVLRTTLTNEWLSFRTIDPNLPLALLPEDWPRSRARSIFMAIYDNLGAPAERRFRQVVSKIEPQIASLASFHTSAAAAATALRRPDRDSG